MSTTTMEGEEESYRSSSGSNNEKNSGKTIFNNFTVLFWPSLVLFFLVGSMLVKDNQSLVTPGAPNGMRSLETSFNPGKSDSIRKQWIITPYLTTHDFECVGTDCPSEDCNNCQLLYKKNGTDAHKCIELAREDLYTDFSFIVVYAFLLLLVLTRLKPSKKKSIPEKMYGVVLALVFLAAVFDMIENAFMLAFLSGQHVSPYWYAVPATIKFILLGIILLYILFLVYKQGWLSKFSSYLYRVFSIVFTFRITFIGLAIAGLPIWFTDQGQDLLANINTKRLGPVLFITIITIQAFLNWYLTKFFFLVGKKDPLMPFRTVDELDLFDDIEAEKKIARFTGVLAFLIPACAVLNALDVFRINHVLNFTSPVAWLVVFSVIHIKLIRYEIFQKWYKRMIKAGKEKKAFTICVAAIVSILVIIFCLGFLTGSHRHPDSLIYLTINLVLLSFAFLLFTSLRTIVSSRYLKGILKEKIGYPVLITGYIITLLFVVVNIFPLLVAGDGSTRFITLPALIGAVITYTVIFTFLLRAGRKTGINFLLFVFVLLFLAAKNNKNAYHEVRSVENPMTSVKYDSLQSMEGYFYEWIQHRNKTHEIDAFHTKYNRKYPIFIVNTYGGGIRAAAFTSYAIGFLDSAVDAVSNQPFEHYVLAYSGASGGTIGASVMCALRYNNPGKTSAGFEDSLDAFYKNDFLTPLVVNMFGRDIIGAPFGVTSWNDRAGVQERTWEKHVRERLNADYSQDYLSYWYTRGNAQYEVPLLFSNTYHANSGLKGIVSPVTLKADSLPGSIFVTDLLAKNNTHISLSTAAFLSARFPLISPTGRIGAGNHFMDGGLKENSGAETALQVYRIIKGLYDKPGADSIKQLLDKTQIYILSLSNSVRTDELIRKENEKNIFELAAPLIGLYNNWQGNTFKADSTNRFLFKDHYLEIWPTVDCIRPDKNADCFVPVLPLGWQISDDALLRMRKGIHKDDAGIRKVLNVFH